MIETQSETQALPTASKTTELSVEGMTCGNCARHVTEAIQSIPGVRNAVVSLEANHASVRWNSGAEDVPAVIEALREAGYPAKPAVAEHDHANHEATAGWQLNLWIGVLGMLPIMIGEWVFGLSAAPWFQWVSFVLATIVQVFAGASFYRGAWNQLKVGSSNMDTLVALGSTTAFVYSAWALLGGFGGHLYFMESSAIIALISTGHWIESRVAARASSALRKLLDLAPSVARLRESEGKEREVPVAQLKRGDVVVLRPGERVPTDGVVIEGGSAVDESMLTGESVPMDKTSGAQLYAGTVSLDGSLVMRVSATGEETALAQIIETVQRAQTSRANIQRLGDRVSNVFVPIVVIIAIAAGLWWGLMPDSANQVHGLLSHFLWNVHPPHGTAAGFIIAAAVLIVACPCAMGLATPAAIMAGANVASQRGILIRDGVALEKAGLITAVLFDKTGTLTAGKPAVVDSWFSDGQANSISVAVGLARLSAHPISQAIAKLSEKTFILTDWKEVRGSGVAATLPGEGSLGTKREAVLGSLSWLKDSRVDIEPGRGFIDQWSATGATLIGLAIDGKLSGLFALRDTLKTGAVDVLKKISRQGLKLYMVTGDNQGTAREIGRQVGIPVENIFAEVRPEKKAEFVRKLQQAGERVAFVGDGINDAPALEQADLAIAVSRASDIAREAADIILLNSEIEAVPEALALARATLRTIKQNLFWAFFYNGVGVPLAALGFMSPILCAAAMGLSDIVVIGNALRLRRLKPGA
jgi:Cu+-exporting ATPase